LFCDRQVHIAFNRFGHTGTLTHKFYLEMADIINTHLVAASLNRDPIPQIHNQAKFIYHDLNSLPHDGILYLLFCWARRTLFLVFWWARCIDINLAWHQEHLFSKI